jgi:predicted ArsR family transcriptional regulator
MAKKRAVLTDKIKLLENDLGQQIQELAEGVKINRTFLAGYLKALEKQGYVRSKKIRPAKVYFIHRPAGR